MAIIQYFKYWKFKLKATSIPIKVIIDYKSLKYFITIKKLLK